MSDELFPSSPREDRRAREGHVPLARDRLQRKDELEIFLRNDAKNLVFPQRDISSSTAIAVSKRKHRRKDGRIETDDTCTPPISSSRSSLCSTVRPA